MRNQRPGAPAGNRGITLIEILVVLVLILILISLASPSLSGMVDRARTRAALDRITTDLFHARMLAVREGERVVLRFEEDPSCPHGGSGTGTRSYRMFVRGSRPREVKAVDLRTEAAGVCVSTNQSDSVSFNSRGLLTGFNNRKIRASRGRAADSMAVSVVGRAYRFY